MLLLVRYARLQHALYAIEVIDDHLIANVELHDWFAVDTVGSELGAELAFGPGAVAARLARAAHLALATVFSIYLQERSFKVAKEATLRTAIVALLRG